jgi:hypothetical protein
MDKARSGAVFPGHASPVLTLRADCSLFTSKPAHLSPYLPIRPSYMVMVNWVNIRTNQTQSSKIEIKNGTGPRIDLPMSLYREYTVL